MDFKSVIIVLAIFIVFLTNVFFPLKRKSFQHFQIAYHKVRVKPLELIYMVGLEDTCASI